MAHAPNCLVLLYPYPDTVRRDALRDALHKTLRSTFLTPRSLPCTAPRKAFGSAIADCRYRAPLTPRLSQYVQYSANRRFWQAIMDENFWRERFAGSRYRFRPLTSLCKGGCRTKRGGRVVKVGTRRVKQPFRQARSSPATSPYTGEAILWKFLMLGAFLREPAFRSQLAAAR